MCAACERAEMAEWPRAVTSEGPPVEVASAYQAPAELDNFLEIDGPSVVEFTNAVEQAEKAIAEVQAEENAARAFEKRAPSLRASAGAATPEVRTPIEHPIP